MTIYYVDPVNGNSGNNGTSTATPKASITQVPGLAPGDSVRWKRGTTDVLANYVTLAGGNATLTTIYEAYANADGTDNSTLPRPIITGGSSSICINFADGGLGKTNVIFRNLDLDGRFNTAITQSIYFATQGAGNITNFLFKNCRFYHWVQTGLQFAIETAASGIVTGITVEDCDSFENAEHGFMAMGCQNVTYRRCRAWSNGVFYLNGAIVLPGTPGAGYIASGSHNFTSRYERTGTSLGAPTGFVYPIVMTSDVARWMANPLAMVNCASYSDGYLVRNTSTPTTPAVGQYGIVGTTIYVNAGVVLGAGTVSLAYIPCVYNSWIGCESWNGINTYPLTAYHEGHGFAWDDYASYNTIRNCYSHDNQGHGYSMNGGVGNVLVNNVATNNLGSGFAAGWSDASNIGYSAIIANNTFVNNCLMSSYATVEIALANQVGKNYRILNNIVSNPNGNSTSYAMTASLSYNTEIKGNTFYNFNTPFYRYQDFIISDITVTNQLTYSNLSGTVGANAATVGNNWGNTGANPTASILNSQEYVDGNLTQYFKVRRIGTSGYEGFQQSITWPLNQPITISCYVRVPVGVTPDSGLTLYFGVVSVTGNAQLLNSGDTSVMIPGKWYRKSATVTFTSTTNNFVAWCISGTVPGTGFDIACPQVEFNSSTVGPYVQTITTSASLPANQWSTNSYLNPNLVNGYMLPLGSTTPNRWIYVQGADTNYLVGSKKRMSKLSNRIARGIA